MLFVISSLSLLNNPFRPSRGSTQTTASSWLKCRASSSFKVNYPGRARSNSIIKCFLTENAFSRKR